MAIKLYSHRLLGLSTENLIVIVHIDCLGTKIVCADAQTSMVSGKSLNEGTNDATSRFKTSLYCHRLLGSGAPRTGNRIVSACKQKT